MPQVGASLTGDFRVVIYNCKMFLIQVTGTVMCVTIGRWATKLKTDGAKVC
jgi:hypothetical protein